MQELTEQQLRILAKASIITDRANEDFRLGNPIRPENLLVILTTVCHQLVDIIPLHQVDTLLEMIERFKDE